MRSNKSALLAALAMSAVLVPGVNALQGSGGTVITEITNMKSKQTPADRGQNLPSDTKSDRLGTGYYRRHKAPVGKRYSASVKQHQRHAAKLRSKSKARSIQPVSAMQPVGRTPAPNCEQGHGRRP